ncbi:MAG: DUF4062 domain-containing protein [Chlorobaculum sp.]|nr:DUF4062 domain-containing protein [Chlorobaculum sp.]
MKIFISSTVNDLKDERSLVRDSIFGMGFETFCSEYEGSRWDEVSSIIEQEISDCHIFLAIYGCRYGHVPSASEKSCLCDGKISVTEAEYRKAKALNKPMLIYINKSTKKEKLQDLFIKEVEDFYKGYYVSYFEQSSQLSEKVNKDVVKLITELIEGNYRYPTDILPNIAVFETPQKANEYVANEIINTLNSRVRPIIGLFAGRTAGAIYDTLIDLCSISDVSHLRNAEFYMNAEHFGLADTHPNTYKNFLKKHLISPVEKLLNYRIEHSLISIPSNINKGSLENIFLEYDSKIGASRIHLQLLGVAPNGQIASIDPSNKAINELEIQCTTMVELSSDSCQYLFPRPATRFDITMGIGNILNCSDRIILVATGESKSSIIKRLLLEPVSALIPVSLLKKHHNFTIVCDRNAIKDLPYAWVSKYPRIFINEKS